MRDNFDIVAELESRPDLIEYPGELLMKGGPKDYIGAALCIRATLYFKGAHLQQVRDHIVSCFEEFGRLSGDVFSWLWRESATDDCPKLPYKNSKPLGDYIESMSENEHLSFYYTGGSRAEDASSWQFRIYGQRGWKAKVGRDTSVVEFSVPVVFFEGRRPDFIALVVKCARWLKAEHGYAGYALNLSPVRREKNEPIEAFLSERMPGMDVGNAPLLADRPEFKPFKIKTVSWLTVINYARLDLVGGAEGIQDKLPAGYFRMYDYGAGVVIQAGAKPSALGDQKDLRPAAYILLDHQLSDIRLFNVGSLHSNSQRGEIRLTGWAADRWLQRFDVRPSEIRNHVERLMQESPITGEDALKTT